MRYQLTFWICLILIGIYCLPVSAQEATQPAKPATQEAPAKKKKEFEDFAKVIEDSKSYEGFFKLYQKKENLYCEIQPSQLDQAVSLHDKRCTRSGERIPTLRDDARRVVACLAACR